MERTPRYKFPAESANSYTWITTCRRIRAKSIEIAQNKLQQDQIFELSHYLNITYAHVSTNRYTITNLQVQLTELNQTLIAAMEDAKFVEYTVAVITDIRIILAKLTL